MSRQRPSAYLLQDTKTRLYWCDGLRDDRKRGWHLLAHYATQFTTRADAYRALNGIKIDRSGRARVQLVSIYEPAAPLLEAACA